jgi:HAD superfamily hydrolase (TIGR01490 family)
MEAEKRITVAAFDFDGTLTHRDSLIPFLHYAAGSMKFAVKIARLSPLLAGYGLGMIRNDRAKERLLSCFFSSRALTDIEAIGNRFAAQRLPAMVTDEAFARFLWHKSQGHVCVLVSASLIHYLGPWAKTVGFDHVIASSLETDSTNRVSGRLLDGNCYGPEKARRLQAWLNGTNATIFAYGDSRGDREMLAMADYPHYRSIQGEKQK